MRKVLRVLVISALAIIFCIGSPAFAHGGVSMEKDVCKLQLGRFMMHFSGYQPEATGSKEFCEDIPQKGPTVVVLDAVEPELRQIPIEVRIIRDTGDESNLDNITILHIPAKTYPTGSISFDYVFKKPGKFVGYVIAGDHGQYKARFPFSVARERYEKYFFMLGAIGLGFALYKYSNRARSKIKADSNSPKLL